MGLLGVVQATGTAGTALNPNKISTLAWVVRFKPEMLPRDQDFEVWHGAALGPGGYFRVYINEDLFGIGENGLINEYAPQSSAMYVRKGQEITFHWSITTTPAPKIWLWLRQPEVGLFT